MPTNKQIHLDNRPDGEAVAGNFKLVTSETPALQDNQVLVRHHYMSLDPYMRGRMNDAKSYAQPQPLGAVMQGGTVGEVVESKHPKYAVGDKIIAPKAGETVVITAASGAVGSAFGALAKARGCRVVGIAGGPDKCKYVTDELGFDACIDYRQHPDVKTMSAALKEACPKGIDGYFENVGGYIFDAVLLRTNAFARVALCGMIAGYDGQPLPLANPALILINRLKIEGFIVSEHMEVWPEALTELGTLVGTGKLKPRESVAQGVEAAPEAFLGLLKGKNFGKQLVKLI
jgi:NADPH-dependent curcumin reductase CurA